MSGLAGLLHPEVERHLLVSEREFIVYQVARHWITRVPGVALICVGAGLLLAMPFAGAGWLGVMTLGLIVGGVGFWKVHVQNMDRFVVTNIRVFRVHGVLNQQMSGVPLARLLDITVKQPLGGQLLNYGHFVFETAAQDQGLKKIGFVPDIENKDLILETVIQRAGIRARAGSEIAEYADFFDSLDADTDDPSRLHRMVARLRRQAPSPNADDGT